MMEMFILWKYLQFKSYKRKIYTNKIYKIKLSNKDWVGNSWSVLIELLDDIKKHVLKWRVLNGPFKVYRRVLIIGICKWRWWLFNINKLLQYGGHFECSIEIKLHCVVEFLIKLTIFLSKRHNNSLFNFMKQRMLSSTGKYRLIDLPVVRRTIHWYFRRHARRWRLRVLLLAELRWVWLIILYYELIFFWCFKYIGIILIVIIVNYLRILKSLIALLIHTHHQTIPLTILSLQLHLTTHRTQIPRAYYPHSITQCLRLFHHMSCQK